MILFASVETAVASFLEQGLLFVLLSLPPREEDRLSEWGPKRIWATSRSISDRMPVFQALPSHAGFGFRSAQLLLFQGYTAENGPDPQMPKALASWWPLGPPTRRLRGRNEFKEDSHVMKTSESQSGIKVRRTKHCRGVGEPAALASPILIHYLHDLEHSYMNSRPEFPQLWNAHWLNKGRVQRRTYNPYYCYCYCYHCKERKEGCEAGIWGGGVNFV